jgi:hypothetical protein
MKQVQELQAQVEAQTLELQQYAANDPEALAKLTEATEVRPRMVQRCCLVTAVTIHSETCWAQRCCNQDAITIAPACRPSAACAVRAAGRQPLAGQHLLAAELVQEEV